MRPIREFNDKLAELENYLSFENTDRTAPTTVALPHPMVQPEKFVLGASIESAELAAKLDWGFTFAAHHDGNLETISHVLRAYSDATGRTGSLALAAVIDREMADAQREADRHRIFRVTLESGRSVNLSTEEAAFEYARQAGSKNYSMEERLPWIVSGTGACVYQQLNSLHERLGVQEFILDIPTVDPYRRLASIRLLAKAAF